MERILRLTLLYDYYGELLTERQQEIFAMYYLHDLSMQEIGDQLEISRQSVNDLLKRTEKLLADYEDKLSLVDQAAKRHGEIKKIADTIENLIHADNISRQALAELRLQLLAIEEIN